MHRDVHPRTQDRRRRREGGPQRDVRKLADGRVCEPGLQIFHRDRAYGRDQDRRRGHVHEPNRGTRLPQVFHPDEDHQDLHHRKDPGLHDGNRVEQCTNGGWRDHRSGQPAMERHQRRLAEAKCEQSQQQREGSRV